MTLVDARQYIGNVSGSTELFNNLNKGKFDNIYALVEDVLGVPVIAQILISAPEAAKPAIEKMLQNVNPEVKISYVDELDKDNDDIK